MGRPMTFRQYRGMDLFIFTALLCLFEALIVQGATRWFPQEPYTLSITAAVTAIVLVRWGPWGLVTPLAGHLAFLIASGAQPQQYGIYLGSSLFAALMLPWLKAFPWQRLKNSVLAALTYGLATCLVMQAGRFLIALGMGYAPGICAGFFTTDVLSALFAVILCGIARSADGLMEEQKHYLLRIQKEEEQIKGE